ncbi:unnamed protein product [Parnassius mnemosyne]|uniref:Uncharacterized protein n=1 Tax=Parnassius mnemosyne TaxID=213953 RepID=A0AAV1KBN2_9NEOP
MPLERKTKEERLAQQRLCKRSRYAEIKNDPYLLALAKEKRRIKYLKDKEAKKITSISEKAPRSQKEQRKKWKENSKRYRQNKKQAKPPNFESIAVCSIQGENTSTHDLGGYPLQQNKPDAAAAIRTVRHVKLRKRKTLLNIIAAHNIQ